jgi:hypothetical protein
MYWFDPSHVFVHCYHMVILLNNYFFILVRVCIWVLGLYNLEVLGVLMGSLEFFYLDYG